MWEGATATSTPAARLEGVLAGETGQPGRAQPRDERGVRMFADAILVMVATIIAGLAFVGTVAYLYTHRIFRK